MSEVPRSADRLSGCVWLRATNSIRSPGGAEPLSVDPSGVRFWSNVSSSFQVRPDVRLLGSRTSCWAFPGRTRDVRVPSDAAPIAVSLGDRHRLRGSPDVAHERHLRAPRLRLRVEEPAGRWLLPVGSLIPTHERIIRGLAADERPVGSVHHLGRLASSSRNQPSTRAGSRS